MEGELAEGMKTDTPLHLEEIKAHLSAFGDAFRAERFDAKTVAAASGATGASARAAGWGAAHMARWVETVSPLLMANQRASFAKELREHATHGPRARVSP